MHYMIYNILLAIHFSHTCYPLSYTYDIHYIYYIPYKLYYAIH